MRLGFLVLFVYYCSFSIQKNVQYLVGIQYKYFLNERNIKRGVKVDFKVLLSNMKDELILNKMGKVERGVDFEGKKNQQLIF